ncbi:hypothetical protein TRFO_15614 [Tritrichomonas foetus]|uniref:Uncharacterized protein n=1 Tax=Tritrichomonas foetus TaxID=1144522 RepID=A0A1J4KS42_9EUKA|nr:hypothetical protein TRFO_15614 [Tritrichomonas foetus]|eukprot:OHT14083.1 hypothetical protein TRFO_15614 [Tritrichomonas foetus]
MVNESDEVQVEERAVDVKERNTCMQNSRRMSYFVLIYISFSFSIAMAVLNTVNLLFVYTYEVPPPFPSGWNLWFNVIFIIAFYLLLYAFVYARSYKNRGYNLNKASGFDNGTRDNCPLITVNVAFITFILSFALHVYTGFFILNYQPADYLTD